MKLRNITLDGEKYVLVPQKRWEAIARKTFASEGKLLKMSPRGHDGNYGLEHVRTMLANKIIARRKAAGLTQAQLARLARVRVETISRLENGLHMPGVRTFGRIDRAITRAAQRPAA